MTFLLASLIKNSGAVSDVEITKESMFVIPDLYNVVNPLRAAKKKKKNPIKALLQNLLLSSLKGRGLSEGVCGVILTWSVFAELILFGTLTCRVFVESSTPQWLYHGR